MAKVMNTCIDFKFEDGDSVKMTLSFYAIYQLKGKNKALYDRYNKIMANGTKEELDMITILYTAYVCANMDAENLLSEEEFMMKCGCDRTAVRIASHNLTSAKKI